VHRERRQAPVLVVGVVLAKRTAQEDGVEAKLPVGEGGDVKGQLLENEAAEGVGQVSNQPHHQAASRARSRACGRTTSLLSVVEGRLQVLEDGGPQAHQLLLEGGLHHLVRAFEEAGRGGTRPAPSLVTINPGYPNAVHRLHRPCPISSSTHMVRRAPAPPTCTYIHIHMYTYISRRHSHDAHMREPLVCLMSST